MERNFIDRLLPFLIGALLIAGAVLLVRRFTITTARTHQIEAVALQRSHEMLRTRIGAMFHEWEEDIMEEAEAVRAGSAEEDLLHRWAVVLRSHWEIISVRLADERGNELAIHRGDSALVVVRTALGGIGGPSMATPYGIAPDSIAEPWMDLGTYDPRERIWFSKALENNLETPIWTLRQFGDTTEKVMQVSFLAQRAKPELPFQVVLFDVSLARARQLDDPTASRAGLALLTSDGDVLAARARPGEAEADSALAWAIANRDRSRAGTGPYTDYAASFETFGINGLSLLSGIVVRTAPLDAWTQPERDAERIAAIWLIAMTLALITLLFRGVRRSRSRTRLVLHNKQLDHRLEKAQGEREVLSREVHHRVKNNLQVVSSLLNLQASSLDDGTVRDEFLRGKRRIDTIALVHHRLYDQPDLRNIDLEGFLKQLTASLALLQGERSRTVSIGVETNGLRCDQDTAIELGIITCELVNNAYQHAFPHATGGHIEVNVARVEGDLHRLVVSNNGVLAERNTLTGPGKLGLEIVEALAEQLDGSLHVRTEGSPAFEVLFRMKRPPSADVA